MNDDLYLTVIRHDGKFHVQASDDTAEWRHKEGFSNPNDAWNLQRQIKAGLKNGRDLNLALWAYAGDPSGSRFLRKDNYRNAERS